MRKIIPKALSANLLFYLVFFFVSSVYCEKNEPGNETGQGGRENISATLEPDFVLTGKGKNVDTIAFWETPDPDETLMFVTAKDNSLVEVWKYPFVNNESAPLIHDSFQKSRVNGVAVDQETALLYVAVDDPA